MSATDPKAQSACSLENRSLVMSELYADLLKQPIPVQDIDMADVAILIWTA